MNLLLRFSLLALALVLSGCTTPSQPAAPSPLTMSVGKPSRTDGTVLVRITNNTNNSAYLVSLRGAPQFWVQREQSTNWFDFDERNSGVAGWIGDWETELKPRASVEVPLTPPRGHWFNDDEETTFICRLMIKYGFKDGTGEQEALSPSFRWWAENHTPRPKLIFGARAAGLP